MLRRVLSFSTIIISNFGLLVAFPARDLLLRFAAGKQGLISRQR